MQLRLGRALKERLFIVNSLEISLSERHYSVIGSTGNVYEVILCPQQASCSCPDPQVPCKHIFLVLLKCYKLNHDDPILWAAKYEEKWLTHLFAAYPISTFVPTETEIKLKSLLETVVNKTVVQQKELQEDDVCSICCDDFKGGETDWCRACCGNHFHTKCISILQKYNGDKGIVTSCPLCRHTWLSKEEEEAGRGQVYINLCPE
jgi:hypothetical protein